jgi:cation diffusion facilitator family transporter
MVSEHTEVMAAMDADEQKRNERYWITHRVTLVGAVVNLILALFKIIIGAIGHSHALIVDGVHSLSDLLSDALVVFAAKQGNASPDENHPYGHARIETVFAAVLGGVLIAVGVGIVIDAMDRLASGNINIPSAITLWVALLSVISKEILYRYTLLNANKINSSLLKANAWHHRSDAISSIVVMIGIGGSIYGIPYLDPAAAVIVAMMVAKIGWEIARESIDQLVDKGLDPEKVASISQHISEIPGVSQMHMLRSRQMGADALLDVHIEVAPQLSVSEGHRISDEVSKQLTRTFPDVSQVLVHVDPENDETNSSCVDLPLREELLAELKQHWSGMELSSLIEEVTLHYLGGKVSVQIILPLSQLQSIEETSQLSARFEAVVKDIECIEKIEILYR